MGLETDVIGQWIDYSSKEIDEIALGLEKRRAEQAYQRRQALKNGIYVLGNMYTYFLEVLSGKNSTLTKTDLARFKSVLDQFKSLEPRHWILMEYPSIIPELELAYSGLRNYVDAKYRKAA